MPTLGPEEPNEVKFSVANVFFAIRDLLRWEIQVGETITMKEAADYLGLSRQRIIQLVRAERLRSAKFGRNVFVPVADLKAYRQMMLGVKAVGGRGHKAASPIFE